MCSNRERDGGRHLSGSGTRVPPCNPPMPAGDSRTAEDPVPADDDRRLTGTFDRIVLERAIAELAAGYRTVLVLHDIHGYTHQEIGTMLGATW